MAIIRVGAVQSAKAYVTASGRQQYEAEPGRRPAELAPYRRQSLMSQLRGANTGSDSRVRGRFRTRFTCSLRLFDSEYYIAGVSFLYKRREVCTEL